MIKLIKSLYGDQQSAVKLECGTTDWFTITKGVRQGSTLSPALCNIYTLNIKEEVLNDDQTEQFDLLHVGGSEMDDLGYADDKAIIYYDFQVKIWSEEICDLTKQEE